MNLRLLGDTLCVHRGALSPPVTMADGCPALLLFPYSTLVVGLLIRWRLQTTVGPSEEGVTITRLSSSDGRTDIRTDMGGLRATHRSPYLLTPC